MAAMLLQMPQSDLSSRNAALTSDLLQKSNVSKHAVVTLIARTGHSTKVDLLVAVRSPFLKTYLMDHYQGPATFQALPPEPVIFVPALNREILEQAKEFLYKGT